MLSLQVRLEAVGFRYPARRLFSDISFTLSGHDRAGLIGENGSGKSTLLGVIAGELDPTPGSTVAVTAEGYTPSIGLLRQEHAFPAGSTVAHVLEQAVAPLRAAAAAVDEAGLELAKRPDDPRVAHAFAEALETAEQLDVWSLDARIEAMLAGLGLAALPREKHTSALSGGQRSRLSLAALLLSRPDVLLLDEPTNHLDDNAAHHLARVITDWRGPVLMASHDRAFLDETATVMFDLDPLPVADASRGGAQKFTGNFSDYLAVREEARQRWERQYRDEQAELRRLRAAVGDSQTVGHTDWKPRTETRMAQKFYADRNARVVARRVNDARQRLENLEASQVQQPPDPLRFRGFTVSRRLGARGRPAVDATSVVSAEGLGVPGRLAPVSFRLGVGERLLITGANGSGKSTLLAALAGRASAPQGSVNVRPGIRVELLTQATEWAPLPSGLIPTALEAYRAAVGHQTAELVPLGSLGLLHPRDEQLPVTALSVGQQRRLHLATLVADPPDLLLLDEPTNHLSLALVEELEHAFDTFAGTLIIASHDRWLRERWGGSTLELIAVAA